jgi:hypothetical protein
MPAAENAYVTLKVAFSSAFSDLAIFVSDEPPFGLGFFAATEAAEAVAASMLVAQRAARTRKPARLANPLTSDDGTERMYTTSPRNIRV